MGTNRPSDLQGSLQRDGDGIPPTFPSSFAQDVADTATPATPSTPVPSSASGAVSRKPPSTPGRRRDRGGFDARSGAGIGTGQVQSSDKTVAEASQSEQHGSAEIGTSTSQVARQSRRQLFKEEKTHFGSDVGPDTLRDPGGGEDSIQTEIKSSTTPKFEHSQTSELTSSSSFLSKTHKTVNIDQGPSSLSSSIDAGSSGVGVASTSAVRVLPARHLCPKCPKTFGSPGKLSQHMYSHTGERPFACQFCPKAFSSKFKLVRHMLIHSDQRQYTCQMCERTFHRKDHLKNHAKVHNPVKSTYTCDRPGCDKEYSSLLSYRKHIAVHAAEDGNLECTMCGLKFPNKDEIVFHLKVHAGSRTVKTAEDRKYHCDHCDRSFFTGKDVRRHMVVHTGKRDFLCQFCPQRFGRKDHLVRHIKKSHNSSGKKTKAKRAEVKTKTVDSILVETGRSKIQASDTKPTISSKPATITSGELFATVSQEANLMSEFEESKDTEQDVFQSQFSDEHRCVVMIASSGSSEVVNVSHGVDEQMKSESTSYISTSTSSSSAPITVVEMSQCVNVPSPAPVDVMSCTNLLSPTVRDSEMGISSNLVYEDDEIAVSNDPRHQHVYHGSDEVVIGSSSMQLTTSESGSHHLHHQEQYHSHRHASIDDNNDSGAVSTAILTPVDAHSFDQPAASSSSSSSYSAMIDSFGLELKPEDLDDLKPSDLDLKAEDLDLKPEDIGDVSENPTTHRETALERNIAIGDLPLLLPILPRPHEEHIHHEMQQMQATHFLAPDPTRNLSRHIINLTAPGAASDNSELIVGLPDFDLGTTSEETVEPVHQETPSTPSNIPSNTTPLPRFNQAFQQQQPPQ